MKDFNKLFLIGLTKTGTNSVTEACNILGVPIRHYPDSDIAFDRVSNGIFTIPELETHRGISDVMAAAFFPDFDRAYPSSKFILTIRQDREAWVESCRKKMKGYHKKDRAENKGFYHLQSTKRRSLSNFLRVATYGIGVWDRERFLHVYDRHTKDVNAYFSDRTDDLLVMDMFNPNDQWDQLCRFLDCPKPDVVFPHLAKSGSRQKRESREAKERIKR